MKSVLLDSSFLIALSNDLHPEHETVQRYFFGFLERRVHMYLSTIVISEYEVKQRATDLGLHNFHVLPFNIDDAITAARVFTLMHAARVSEDSRVALSGDAKIIGQCVNAGVEVFASGDSHCCRRLEALRRRGLIPGVPRALDVRQAFDASWFVTDGQRSLYD